MFGIVLCGGASSRMGRDKGLLPAEKGYWAEKGLDNFKKLEIPGLLSVNRRQFDQYRSLFPGVELICDDDSLQIRGPLAAVLSAHLKFPADDLLITACDMPLMDFVVLENLVNHYKKEPGHNAYVYTDEGEPEPLCGIYSAKGLAAIISIYDRGELLKHSMKFMLGHLSVIRIPIPDTWKIYFRNINTHADLNGL